jgi:hypothetical protein
MGGDLGTDQHSILRPKLGWRFRHPRPRRELAIRGLYAQPAFGDRRALGTTGQHRDLGATLSEADGEMAADGARPDDADLHAAAAR